MRELDFVSCVNVEDVCSAGVRHIVAATPDRLGFVYVFCGEIIPVFWIEAWLFEPGIVVGAGFVTDVAGGFLPDAVVGESDEGNLKVVKRYVWG